MSSMSFPSRTRVSRSLAVISGYILFGSKFIKRHAREHAREKYENKGVPEQDVSDGGSGADSGESPADPEQNGSADEFRIYGSFFLPGEMPLFSEERFGIAFQKEVSDNGDAHRSDHHEDERRIPISEDIEKSLCAGRGEHVRECESGSEEDS